MSLYRLAERGWRRLLVSHSGKYSVERLVALEEYTQTASPVRVLLVCLLSPLPVLFIVLGMECVPLSDPSEGWRANYGVLIWTAVIVIIGGCAMVDQMRFFVAQIVIRPGPVIGLSVCLSIVPIVASIAFAEAWGFPTPFLGVLLSPINVVAFLIAGAYFFRSVLNDVNYFTRFKHYGVFLNVLGGLLIVYPAYTVVFAKIANAGYEVSALLILSVIRIAFRNAFAWSASHLEDAIPLLVIFTADYFNSVYLATNMQSVSSTLSVLVVFVIDWGQLLLSLRWLLRRLSILEKRIESIHLEAAQSSTNALFKAAILADISDAKLTDIRLWSCIPHKLSEMSAIRLESMQTRFNTEPRTRSQTRWSFPHLVWANRVAPAFETLGPTAKLAPKQAEMVTAVTTITAFHNGKKSAANAVSQLDQALRLAFTIEYTALSEYLEVVVPIIYTIYVRVLRQLPNAKYHSNLVDMNDSIFDRTVSNMLLYGLMELFSFALLFILLRVRVRLNILYVVAFVLETQATLVQGMLITWMTITRQYEIQHFGACIFLVGCVLARCTDATAVYRRRLHFPLRVAQAFPVMYIL